MVLRWRYARGFRYYFVKIELLGIGLFLCICCYCCCCCCCFFNCITIGRQDSSGVRFYYTPNLRQYDSDVITIGDAINPFMVIPPKQESWQVVGYCPKECYQVRLSTF